MNVLFLTNIPSPYRVDFFNELGKYCNLTVLYERKQALNRQWSNKTAIQYKEVYLKGKAIGADMAICFDVIKYLRKKWDIVVICGYNTPTAIISLLYLRLRRKECFISLDGAIIKNEKRINHIIKSILLHCATWYLSSGEETNKYLQEYGIKSNLMYLYPFTSVKDEYVIKAPLSSSQKFDLRKKLGIKYSKMIISVGQFIPRKGNDILIRIASKISKDIGVYIIGGDPPQEYIDLKEKYSASNVEFINFMPSENLKEFYLAADLFITTTREDIWGLVVNEAVSCGLPIIASDKCVAGKELIKSGNCGKIVNIKNDDEIVEAIESMISDNKNIQKNSVLIAQEYTIEKMANAHMKAFSSVH